MQMNAYRRTIFQTSAQSLGSQYIHTAPVNYFKLASVSCNYVMHCLDSLFIGLPRATRKCTQYTPLRVICINKHWRKKISWCAPNIHFFIISEPIAFAKNGSARSTLILDPLNLIEEQV
jgi:hypothetical protein